MFVGDHLNLDRKIVSFSSEELFFFFGRSPHVGQKNRINFGEDLFFFFLDITLTWTENPTKSDKKSIKIWVKFV